MSYLTQTQLEDFGFAALGRNVLISDKACIYNAEKMMIADNCRIDDFCVVSGKVDMGRNVHFAPFCLIAGGVHGIVFGDFSGLAYHAQVFTQSDDYSGKTMTNPTVPALYKVETKKDVRIGRHVIVGAAAVVGPGVIIGDGAAIGAQSLVLNSIAPWSIYAGNPARKIKDRDRGLLSHEAAYLSAESAKRN